MKAAEIAALFEQELGFKTHMAAGMLGSTFGESSHDYTAFNPADPNGGSYGFAQWNGPRKKALDNFAAKNGYSDWTSPEAQVKFMIHELKTTEKKTLQAMLKANTAEEAAAIWTNLYERPAKNEDSMRKRIAQATRFNSALGGGEGHTSVVGGTSDTLGTENPYAALLDFDFSTDNLSMGTGGATKKKMTPMQAIAAAAMNIQYGEEGIPFALSHLGTHSGEKGAGLTAAEAILGGIGGYVGGPAAALLGEAIGGLFGGSNQTEKRQKTETKAK
jgi:hypothetical protein